MKPVVLTDVLAVGEFPTLEQVEILAKAGFKSIINTQPDGEVARFEPDARMAAEASRHGLAHAYAPLSSRTPPAGELACYARALSALPAPIYAFCYSGSRSAAACALLLAAHEDVEAILRQFDEAGFDLSGLKPWLEAERAQHRPSGERDGSADHTVGALGGAVPAHAGGATKVNDAGADDGRRREIVVHPRVASFGGYVL